jgi:hypothetical protein
MRIGPTLDSFGDAATRPLFLGRAQSPYGLPPPPKKKQESPTIFFQVPKQVTRKAFQRRPHRPRHVPHKSGLGEEGAAEQETDILLDSCR